MGVAPEQAHPSSDLSDGSASDRVGRQDATASGWARIPVEQGSASPAQDAVSLNLCDPARISVAMKPRYSPAYSPACFKNASKLIPGSAPPAILISTRQGASGSPMTSAAARSEVSSAARDHSSKARYIPRTGRQGAAPVPQPPAQPPSTANGRSVSGAASSA